MVTALASVVYSMQILVFYSHEFQTYQFQECTNGNVEIQCSIFQTTLALVLIKIKPSRWDVVPGRLSILEVWEAKSNRLTNPWAELNLTRILWIMHMHGDSHIACFDHVCHCSHWPRPLGWIIDRCPSGAGCLRSM